MEIAHSFGCGDFLMIENYLSEKERDDFASIFYAFNDRQSDALRSLIEANPRYAKVKHKYLSYPTEKPEGSIGTLADQGILHRKTFTGSWFLRAKLADISHDLPERFDFIQPFTSLNTKSVQLQRNMGACEWDALLNRLEVRDVKGLVIDSSATGEIPQSDRLIDLRGKTTMPEAVEILKRANGYAGIDSCFAILAAQLFGPNDLLIRTTNPHLVAHCWQYYPPHKEIDFLTPCIGKPRYPVQVQPEPLADGFLVDSRVNILVGVRNFGPGDRVELPRERAEQMIAAKQVIPYVMESQ